MYITMLFKDMAALCVQNLLKSNRFACRLKHLFNSLPNKREISISCLASGFGGLTSFDRIKDLIIYYSKVDISYSEANFQRKKRTRLEYLVLYDFI